MRKTFFKGLGPTITTLRAETLHVCIAKCAKNSTIQSYAKFKVTILKIFAL